jgi:hypothetical protein
MVSAPIRVGISLAGSLQFKGSVSYGLLKKGCGMIDEVEFERRVDHWFGLVLKALESNIGRVIQEPFELPQSDLDDPNFPVDTEIADLYQRLYLPEDVLAFHLDPLMPAGFFDKVNRFDFLLERGMAQHQAKRIGAQIIDKIRKPCS